LQKGTEGNKNMKKIGIIFLMIFVGKASANCSIIGWPGCSNEDYQNAQQLQRQIYIQEQQLRELRRANELTQQLIQQQQMAPLWQDNALNPWRDPLLNPFNNPFIPNTSRCFGVPLGTRGC